MFYVRTIGEPEAPKQNVRGENDTALPDERFGRTLHQTTGTETFTTRASKHFLQEDQAPAIVDLGAALTRQARSIPVTIRKR